MKDYVREHRRRRREMFVPLTHPPGHAQADFGEAWAVIAGVKQKVHFFAFDLPQSDASYVRAHRAATAEAWVAAPRRTRDNEPMTKSELIHRIAQKQSQIVERDVELAVKMMLEEMAACLAGGGRIEIRGFGSFSLRFHPARVGRNPRTGTPVSLPARYTHYFKPGQKLRERVNREYRGPPEAQRYPTLFGTPRSRRLPPPANSAHG